MSWHEEKMEVFRAEVRLEEAKASTAREQAARELAQAALAEAARPVRLAEIEADVTKDLDARRVAAEERSEALAFWSRIAVLVAVSIVLSIIVARLPG